MGEKTNFMKITWSWCGWPLCFLHCTGGGQRVNLLVQDGRAVRPSKKIVTENGSTFHKN